MAKAGQKILKKLKTDDALGLHLEEYRATNEAQGYIIPVPIFSIPRVIKNEKGESCENMCAWLKVNIKIDNKQIHKARPKILRLFLFFRKIE